jgi:N-acetylglucosamine kinase-like BadF-type ATPase
LYKKKNRRYKINVLSIWPESSTSKQASTVEAARCIDQRQATDNNNQSQEVVMSKMYPDWTVDSSHSSQKITHYEPMLEAYYLGIDGGGTNTRAVITDANYKILGEGHSEASNPLRVGFDIAVTHIEEAIDKACSQAGLERREITAGCIALAGISDPAHHRKMEDALDSALGVKNIKLVTDASAALFGALDGQPGVIIIAGTGSIAMGINEAGEHARSGGWGPTLSDEGSAYDIARRALKAVIASFDGRLPHTLLTERICDRLGIRNPSDLPRVIYTDDMDRTQIASLAVDVTEVADEGDRVAREILEGAGRELGELAGSVIEKLRMQDHRFRLAFIGSVFNAGNIILDPLREAIRKIAPGAVVDEPLFPPTVGAAKLARASIAA